VKVSNDIRDKDREVHNFMKKRNVYLGSTDSPFDSVAKSSFTNHTKKVVDEVNGENPLNSNFKKHIYLNGSPTHETQMESKYSTYGQKLSKNDKSALEMNNKNKQLKRELLSHAFNLGYGKDTHKRGSSMDVIQHMKQLGLSVGDSSLLKKKIERQNFKYSQDISVGLNQTQEFFYKKQGERRCLPLENNGHLPNDYRKTNFTFNQVNPKTETGSLANSMYDYNGPLKNSLKPNKSGFSDLNSHNLIPDKSMQISNKNKVKANRSNFTVGYSKGDFSTSYNNNFKWNVPKIGI
jgi:hypothetical protein